MRLRELVDLVTRSPAGSADFVRGARLLAARAFSADEPVASAATSAIFLDIVEPWSDRFSSVHCDAYVAFMSEVMYASGSPVAAELAREGLQGPAELARRYSSIRTAGRPDPLDPERVTTAVVLSRVTLGADVAVTSAVIRAVLRAFPRASVTFLAPRKNLALLTGDERIDGREVSYGRSSLLAERLAAWPMIREQVQACTVGLSPGQSVVIDPDSRLTQLGLLPVTDDRHYRFFESRSWLPESPAPLGRVATEWCASMWGIDAEPVRPFVRSGFGEEALCDQLRTGSVRPVSTISLGVGGRESKRLDGGFEDALLDLLRERGYMSVLDCGAGETEARRARRRYRAFSGSKCHRDEGSRAPSRAVEPDDLEGQHARVRQPDRRLAGLRRIRFRSGAPGGGSGGSRDLDLCGSAERNLPAALDSLGSGTGHGDSSRRTPLPRHRSGPRRAGARRTRTGACRQAK